MSESKAAINKTFRPISLTSLEQALHLINLKNEYLLHIKQEGSEEYNNFVNYAIQNINDKIRMILDL